MAELWDWDQHHQQRIDRGIVSTITAGWRNGNSALHSTSASFLVWVAARAENGLLLGVVLFACVVLL